MTTQTSKVKAGAADEAAPAAKFTVKLAHPSFIIQPCPNCKFPEADGGYCPECGWTLYRVDCPHCNKGGVIR